MGFLDEVRMADLGGRMMGEVWNSMEKRAPPMSSLRQLFGIVATMEIRRGADPMEIL